VALDQAAGSGLAAALALAVAVGLGLGSVVAAGSEAAAISVAGQAAVGLEPAPPQSRAPASPLPWQLQPSGGCIGGERKGCEASPWYVGAGQPSALHGHFAAPCLYSHGE
jgi:hypothetical protein